MKKGFLQFSKRISALFLVLCMIFTLLPFDAIATQAAAASKYSFRVVVQSWDANEKCLDISDIAGATMSAELCDWTNQGSIVSIKALGKLVGNEYVIEASELDGYTLFDNGNAQRMIKITATLPQNSDYVFIREGQVSKEIFNCYCDINDLNNNPNQMFWATDSTKGASVNFCINGELKAIDEVPGVTLSATMNGASCITNGVIPYATIKTITENNPLKITVDASNSQYTISNGNGSHTVLNDEISWSGFGNNLVYWLDLENGTDVRIWINDIGGVMHNGSWNGFYNYGDKISLRTNATIPAAYQSYFRGYELGYYYESEEGWTDFKLIRTFPTMNDLYEYVVNSTDLPAGRDYELRPIWSELHNVQFNAGIDASFVEKYICGDNNGQPVYDYSAPSNGMGMDLLPGVKVKAAWFASLEQFNRPGYSKITNWYLYTGKRADSGMTDNGRYEIALDSNNKPITFSSVEACKEYTVSDKDVVFYAQWDNETMPDALDGWGWPYGPDNMFSLEKDWIEEGETASIFDLGLKRAGILVTKAELSDYEFSSDYTDCMTIDKNGNITGIDDTNGVGLKIKYTSPITGEVTEYMIHFEVKWKSISSSDQIYVYANKYEDEEGTKKTGLNVEIDVKDQIDITNSATSSQAVDAALNKLLNNPAIDTSKYDSCEISLFRCDSAVSVKKDALNNLNKAGYNSIIFDIAEYSIWLGLDEEFSDDFKPVVANVKDSTVDAIIKDSGYTGKYIIYKVGASSNGFGFSEWSEANYLAINVKKDEDTEVPLYVYKIDEKTNELIYFSSGCIFAWMNTYEDSEETWEAFSYNIDWVEGDATYVVLPECLHEWNEGKVVNVATCNKAGTKEFECLICEATKTESYTDANNHVGGEVTKNKEFATTIKAGYTGDVCCASCGKVLEKGTVIPKIKTPVEVPTEIITDTVNKIEKVVADSSTTEKTIVIDMVDDSADKVATVIPTEILEAAKGRDIDVTFDMNVEERNGYSWTINGKDIDKIADEEINLEVTVDTEVVPEAVIDKLTESGEETMQISLTHDGEFGFDAVLTLNVGKDKAGKFVNLYWYKDNGEAELLEAAKVDKDGLVELNFSHASDYILVYANVDKTKLTDDKPVAEPDKKNPTATSTKPAKAAKTADVTVLPYVVLLLFALAITKKTIGDKLFYKL